MVVDFGVLEVDVAQDGRHQRREALELAEAQPRLRLIFNRRNTFFPTNNSKMALVGYGSSDEEDVNDDSVNLKVMLSYQLLYSERFTDFPDFRSQTNQ